MAWQGKILRINLTSKDIISDPLNREWAERYIGLRGLGTKYLVEESGPGVDPLAPENPLIFATGPLTGTPVPTGGRFGVITKGALTGAIACSNSGGYFGGELKLAGWDMVIITGCAAEPCYVLIEDDHVEILPARGFIWGESFWSAEEKLLARHGQPYKVAGIGRAGEYGARYACVMNDRDRAAGRSGVGAVMGSKNLKAIAVRGTRGVRVHNPKAFTALVGKLKGKVHTSPTRERLSRNGTNGMMSVTQNFGSLPTRNCQDVQFEGADEISAEAMRHPSGPGRKPNLVSTKACFACTIGCGRIARIQPDHFSLKAGERYGKKGGGLEYESAYSLGAMTGVSDIDAATFANMVCNEDGMDPMSFGVTLAAAMELYHLGIISNDDTGGIALEFGSAEALVEMVQLTGKGEGFGSVLGLGAWRMCEKYARPELAMTVKGQEFPGYDPRAMQGMGLAYATSNRGACHMRASPYASDFSTAEIDGKAQIVADTQDQAAVIDALGICAFTKNEFSLDDYGMMLEAACGGSWPAERLRTAGERIWTLERMYNLDAGMTASDDTLPPRMFNEPAKSGVNQGKVSMLNEMLPEYYEIRGWSEDGVPLPATLERLKL